MKRQVTAIGSAIGMYFVTLLPFALGYFLLAMTFLWDHGSSHSWESWLIYSWLLLAAVVPCWAAVASYRKMMQPGDAHAP